jgi:hypothetical protein
VVVIQAAQVSEAVPGSVHSLQLVLQAVHALVPVSKYLLVPQSEHPFVEAQVPSQLVAQETQVLLSLV